MSAQVVKVRTTDCPVMAVEVPLYSNDGVKIGNAVLDFRYAGMEAYVQDDGKINVRKRREQ